MRAVARESYERTGPDDFDALPDSDEDLLFDVIIREATVCAPNLPAFRADVGIKYDWPQPATVR